MNTPSKVTITITADGYQTILTDSDGNKIWQQSNKMDSASMCSVESGPDIFDCKWLEDMGYDDLQSAIDELSSGPFLVASSLYDLKGE
tara:strand:- start:6297 stop:6560 length:264 start_codon:yes stop_codon:yes gene_type:complete